MSLVIVKGEGSHCMATTSGAQHGLSLYLRVCCVNSYLGQTVHMRENNQVVIAYQAVRKKKAYTYVLKIMC